MFSNVKRFTFENILHPNKWSISIENDYILHFALCSLWFRLFYFIFISRRTKGVQPNYIRVCKRHHKKRPPHQKENTG